MKAKPSETWVREGQAKALRKKSRKGKAPAKVRVKSPLAKPAKGSPATTVKTV